MTPPPTPSTPSRALHTLAAFTLYALLLILALRLTMTETFHQTLAQVTSQYAAQINPKSADLLPDIGPPVTLGFASLTLLLTALSAFCAWRTAALAHARLAKFLLIATILTLATLSTLAAANRFVSLVGLADLSMALLAGWSLSLLCHPNLLGTRGKKIAAAALLSILAVSIAKGFYQRAIDIPETIRYYHENKTEAITNALGSALATRPDDPAVKLLESRVLSKEVTGFLSSSNTTATALVGLLALLTGLAAARLLQSRPITDPDKNNTGEIPLPLLLSVIAILLILLGTIVLFLTLSRGGSAAGALCIIAVTLGAWRWKDVLKHRRKIITAAILTFSLAAAALITYGISRDSLPSKSLAFRWHYWTASVTMIEQHPSLGVGLNNFGDYYPAFKRASSPEEVKDPHSFFIRLAAEIGLPATLLIALLLLWVIFSALHTTPRAYTPWSPTTPLEPRAPQTFQSSLAPAIFFPLLWWTVHFFLAEPSVLYTIEMSAIFAVIAAAAWLFASASFDLLDSPGIRFLTLASLIGALGMLLYDQINLALVTGPVAMLFWIMLALADSEDPPTQNRSITFRAASLLPAIACTLAGLALALHAWLPTLNNTMPWDPAPYITRYLQTITPSDSTPQPDYPAAKTALEAALLRAPRSIELHQQLLLVLEKLHQPSHQEIQTILQLNHTNPRIRMSLALSAEDLSPTQRLQLLQEALTLNTQLPADELTRLNENELSQINQTINELKNAPPAQTLDPRP